MQPQRFRYNYYNLHMMLFFFFFFFFFQAEDGIRDLTVTGVQTCALPISREAFIPNDVRLDEGGRVILLTGPNMAGKSTLLRQVGLCVLLAQVGCFEIGRASCRGRG